MGLSRTGASTSLYAYMLCPNPQNLQPLTPGPQAAREELFPVTLLADTLKWVCRVSEKPRASLPLWKAPPVSESEVFSRSPLASRGSEEENIPSVLPPRGLFRVRRSVGRLCSSSVSCLGRGGVGRDCACLVPAVVAHGILSTLCFEL